MKTPIVSVLCAAAVALHGAAYAGGEGWISDFSAAKKQAAEEKKDLLIDFTGSDWCGWCIKLNDEVFKHDAFKAGVKDKFVLVEIDFPNDKSKISEETQKQNKELGEKYEVQGYPTILLTDAQGVPYAASGYQQGGPEKYVEHLNELRLNKTKRDDSLAAAAKAEGVEKAKHLVAALDAVKVQPGLVSKFYGDVVEQIKAADPKDETGFTKKLNKQKRLGEIQEKLEERASEGDMDGALEVIDKALEEGGFETENTLELMMTRAVIFAQQEKFDEALKAVDQAKAFAPDSPMMENIENFRKRLESMKDKGKKAPEGEEAKPEAKPEAKE
jgi:thioredoxin-related protein